MPKLFNHAGFSNPISVSFGTTNIPNAGELNLWERQDESICVEAFKPSAINNICPFDGENE